MTLSIIVSVLVLLAFIADLYTTKRAVIDNPTRFHEGNPIMGRILKLGGFKAMVFFKLLIGVGIVLAMVKYPDPIVLGAGIFAALSTGTSRGATSGYSTSRSAGDTLPASA